MVQILLSKECIACPERACEEFLPGLLDKSIRGILLVSDENMQLHQEKITSAMAACPAKALTFGELL